MNKRWLSILVLFIFIVPLAIFSLYHSDDEIAEATYELSSLKLSEFDEIFIDFPSKAATSFKKINGFWYQTKPYQTRADQNIVYRLLSILAARSKEKLDSLQIEKYGLDKPKLKMTFAKENEKKFLPLVPIIQSLNSNTSFLTIMCLLSMEFFLKWQVTSPWN